MKEQEETVREVWNSKLKIKKKKFEKEEKLLKKDHKELCFNSINKNVWNDDVTTRANRDEEEELKQMRWVLNLFLLNNLIWKFKSRELCWTWSASWSAFVLNLTIYGLNMGIFSYTEIINYESYSSNEGILYQILILQVSKLIKHLKLQKNFF